MRKRILFLVVFLLLAPKGSLFSNNPSNSQIINVTISAQNAFVLVGPTPDFQLSSSDIRPGKMSEITDDSTGFSIVIADDTVKKVVAQLDAEMPKGMELYVYFAPPPSGKSTGLQKLSTVDSDILRNLTKDSTIYTPNVITYQFYFGREALDVESFSRKIVYTLMDQ